MELEGTMKKRRDKANEPVTLDIPILELTNAEIAKNTVWEDYRYRQKNKICSRCGQYNKYEITEKILYVQKDLNDRYGYNFHEKEYDIKSTTVLNKNSLDSDWGGLCKRCQLHVSGFEKYPLSASRADAERELSRLKTTERTRQMYQDDDIKTARVEFNKERREAIEDYDNDSDDTKAKTNHHQPHSKNRKIFPSFKDKEQKEKDDNDV